MRFVTPEWLLFLLVVAFLGFYWRRLELYKPLRALIILVLVALLVEPQLRRYQEGLDLWLLVDRSASAEAELEPRLEEWETLVREGRGPKDRLFVVDYAEEAQQRGSQDSLSYAQKRKRTRTALAIRQAMLERSPERSTKLLVFTDGYSTDNLEDVQDLLLANDVPLDIRLAGGERVVDYRVRRFRLTDRVQVNEPFLIDVEVNGVPDATFPYNLFRGENKIKEGEITVSNGIGRLMFTDRIPNPGSYEYTVQLLPGQDSIPANNISSQWIEIASGPRILLISGYTNDPLREVLRQMGFAVELVTDYDSLSAGSLSGAKAVILHNVPANVFQEDFLPALDFFVRGQGGGLMMVGGPQSYGSGGYHNSPIDEVLPVSMELRQEHRKLTTAMAIVMDRSGSMSMTVPGSGKTKMQLANTGATAAVELLGENDFITVFAVDSLAHEEVPLMQVGPNRNEIAERTSRIESMGGGIFVFTGLKAAWSQLQKAEVGQKHVILFSDAADSEEPGSYRNLIAEMVDNRTTVSVIGLGTDSDPDAEFLKDIAKRGNGRIFFNSDPATLPAIFTQETVAVARSAFIKELTGLSPTASWREIAAAQLNWLQNVDGYNLSYLRPEATSAAFTIDEFKAPLVAYWQRGTGRAAAVTFPLAGEHSETVRGWGSYGDFTQTLARWLMGEEVPPGIGYRAQVEGDELELHLLYDETWEERIAREVPRVVVSDGGMEASQDLVWRRLEPGHFSTSAKLDSDKPMRGAIQVGESVIPFGPFYVGEDTEWQTDPTRIRDLRRLSSLTGGSEVVDLETVWQRQEDKLFTSLRIPLLILLAILIIADALQTRLHIRGDEFRKLGGLLRIGRRKAA